MEDFSVESNKTYKEVNSSALQLDVYYPATKLGKEPWERLSEKKHPTIIYFHGGGWISGDRTSRFLGLLPYLEKGWCAVNVDYRLLQETNLLGSLDDCIDAINWTYENASRYNIDTEQIFLSGESAGGHLALLSGMVNEFKLEDHEISTRKAKIKAIINWYGITEMESAIRFWNDDSYTKVILEKWDGSQKSYLEFTSPRYHIASSKQIPILTIHGDMDENVHFDQAISFHDELDSKTVPNKLIRVRGKKHGNFSAKELESIYRDIWQFLESKKSSQLFLSKFILNIKPYK